MKLLLVALACALLLTLTYTVKSQTTDVDRLDEKLHKHLEKKMPGWSYKRIEPIQGSSGVLIQVWSIQNRAVRIVVVTKKSAAEAKESMANFQRNVHEAQPWLEAGDEGYAWGFDLRQIHFRRGKTIFDIEVGADVSADADAGALAPSQRSAREKSEIKKWTKEFASHVVDAVDAP